MTDTFPRQYARTQRLTLGEPRNLTVSPDGSRVLFLRSRGGDDPVNCLWLFDIEAGGERLLADPHVLLGRADADDLPPEEKARRERLREGAGGITSFSVDADHDRFVFGLGGRLFAGEVDGPANATVDEIEVGGPVFDPRLDPTGRLIGFVTGDSFRVIPFDDHSEQVVAAPSMFGDGPDVTWGSAEFIAAEEMGRYRGFWFSPDGTRVAVCRVDESPVPVWHIADPANPQVPPRAVRYPAAGTSNADVSLHVFMLDDGRRVDVEWDRAGRPYLATVAWTDDETMLISVSSRDQRTIDVLDVAAASGRSEVVHTESRPDWVDLVPGSPARLRDGSLVMVVDREGSKRLVVDGAAVTPVELNVRSIVSIENNRIVFLANHVDHPERLLAWHTTDSSIELIAGDHGTQSVTVGGTTSVVKTASVSSPRTVTVIRSAHRDFEIHSHAERALVDPRPVFVRAGRRRIPSALLLPRDHRPGTRLPVLMDPYGGPHAQRVVDSYNAHCTSQWFADQGFAVIVADGRGTPALGTDWERAVHLDLAAPVLDDQIDALHAVASEHPDLDLTRVGIRGWSFGGYLAALAVLRRPDVFHAAVAGAPVTEWRLYDTHYTERYLGDPMRDPAPYDATSLVSDASRLSRPLLLVHGLADDNVVAAHTLQFSSALLASGRPHEVLPLSGVTHMTPQAVVAENLLLHQLDFLRRSLS